VAHLYFTPNLARQVECPAAQLEAVTVRELFDRYFSKWPAVRGYVLDDQGAVRKHVKVIVDEAYLQDRMRQSDPVRPDSKIYVFQLLSGG
jgi:hypothetical protein